MNHPGYQPPTLSNFIGEQAFSALRRHSVNVDFLREQAGKLDLPTHFPQEEFWRGDKGTRLFERVFLASDERLKSIGHEILIMWSMLSQEGHAAKVLQESLVTEQILLEIINEPSEPAGYLIVQETNDFQVLEFLGARSSTLTPACLAALAKTWDYASKLGLSSVPAGRYLFNCLLMPFCLKNAVVRILHNLRTLAPLHFFYPGFDLHGEISFCNKAPSKLAFSPDLEYALDVASAAARSLSSSSVGSEHLLVGLASIDGNVKALLVKLGVTVDEIRRELNGLTKDF